MPFDPCVEFCGGDRPKATFLLVISDTKEKSICHAHLLLAERDSAHSPTMQANQISFDAPGTITNWLPINDAGMGGMSIGRFNYSAQIRQLTQATLKSLPGFQVESR